MSVETARSRAAGLTALILMDIADALDLNPQDISDDWKAAIEAFATGVFVSGRVNRMAWVGALIYTASNVGDQAIDRKV